MTNKQAVDRGLAIIDEMDALSDELKKIETQLREAALTGEQIDLEDAERDGKQFLARGSAHIVPVVLTADLVVASFKDASPVHARLEGIAGRDMLKAFFRPETTWKGMCKSGKAFRREAAALLENQAAAFVDAALARDKYGIPKSQIKIEWDRKEEVK